MVLDELYAPLGLPLPQPAPPRLRLRKAHVAALAPAALALAFSASSLDRHEPPRRAEPAPLAAAEQAPALASPAKPLEGEKPATSPPIASASVPAGGVEIVRGVAPGLPPGGVFINVREALAGRTHPSGEAAPAPDPSAR